MKCQTYREAFVIAVFTERLSLSHLLSLSLYLLLLHLFATSADQIRLL